MKSLQHPGVYVPPPFFYAVFFLLSIGLQKLRPLDSSLLNTNMAKGIGLVLLIAFLYACFFALRRFFISKNTLIPNKPARSLETSGIYARSRNPMYLSLLFLYAGLAVFIGNWWTFLFLPLVILVIQLYVIRREELYLQQAFGEEYRAYASRVRRWI